MNFFELMDKGNKYGLTLQRIKRPGYYTYWLYDSKKNFVSSAYDYKELIPYIDNLIAAHNKRELNLK